jgi:2-polyprenyl-3-methyl-5-hydroxy-6-metoxy-1,4-benzoquinol methylase
VFRRRFATASGSTLDLPEAEKLQDKSPAAEPVEVISTLDRLDEKLLEIEDAAAVSDDKVRSVFASFRMEIPINQDADPWSEAYRAAQFDLYRRITSRTDYSTSNEISGYAVDPKIPFPYYTQSSNTVGDQLMAVGFLIKTMALQPKSSILEFGPGWGNTTVALARMGYEVTALDIDPNFVKLIKDRAHLLGLTLDARVGEFTDAASIECQYDAVLFYECFHHCSDHIQLLADLHRLIKPGGRVFLAAEPILESFHAPWGLRLDGESLWAARANGWLELGFTESYFIEACARQRWKVVRVSADASPLTSIFCLAPLQGSIYPGQTVLPPKDESGWAVPDSPESTQRYTTSRSRLVCPVGMSWSTISIHFVNPAPLGLPYNIRHGPGQIRGRIQPQSRLSLEMPYHPESGEIVIETETWCPALAIPGSTDQREIGIGVLEVGFR